jgi:hypothetical protein
MSLVLRFREALTPSRLAEVLTGQTAPTERMPSSVELEPLSEAIASIPEGVSGSALDTAVVEPVHRSLAGLTHAEAADMRVWHWLCGSAFPSFVWRRWRPNGEPGANEVPTSLTDSMVRRFLGTPTLVGVSRNTFARLWWTAEHLDADYDLARRALARQDPFQAIFERLFGLHLPAARAAIRSFEGKSEAEARRAARWLNYAAATAVLEALSEDEIAAILDESLAAPPA